MKKKHFLLPLLMAIVMMAMSPAKVWADDLTPLTAEQCTTLGLDAATYTGYYAIGTASDLTWFRDFVNTAVEVEGNTTYPNTGAKAVLTADIDMSSICHAADAENSVSMLSWKPIGAAIYSQWYNYAEDAAYLGTFDGNGHELRNLYINADGYYNGLIGILGKENATEKACVKNLTIIGSITTTQSNTGAIAGMAINAEIINCINKANLQINSIAGGLVGKASAGNVSSNVSIKKSSNLGNITSTGGNIGGIVGSCFCSLTIEDCMNAGSITSSDDCSAGFGGLIGYYYAPTHISKSYNTGSIAGSTQVGGLVGSASGNSELQSSVVDCYNTGKVTSESENYANVGGIFGWVEYCTVSNVFSAASIKKSGTSEQYGAFAGGYSSSNTTFTNCYFDNEKSEYPFCSESTPSGSNGGKSTAAFASGEMAYLLNGSRSAGTAESPLVWYQAIGVDAYPTFDQNQYAIVKYNATDGYYNDPENFASIEIQDGEAYTDKLKRTADQLTYKRTFANTTYNALYVPFAMSYSDWSEKADIYRLLVIVENDNNDDGNIDEWVLKVVKLKDGESTKANTPYIIKPKTEGEMTLTLQNVLLAAAEEKSIWCASTDYKFVFKGTYAEKAIAADSYFFVSTTGGLQYSNEAETLKPQRWYMGIYNKDTDALVAPSTFNTTANNVKGIRISVEGDDEATGIADVNDNANWNNGKRLENGRIVILKNGKKYNTSGQQIK